LRKKQRLSRVFPVKYPNFDRWGVNKLGNWAEFKNKTQATQTWRQGASPRNTAKKLVAGAHTDHPTPLTICHNLGPDSKAQQMTI